MKIQKRRRKENKTDYKKRLNMLKGKKPRLVFRRTNNYIISQYVTSKEAQDKVEFGVNSKDLISYGWPKEFLGSLKSIPAAYLTGFLTGKKIAIKKLETPILDTGMMINVHKGRFFSFVKGLKDAGINVRFNQENIPEENRIKGKNLKKDFSGFFEKIKAKINNEAK